MVATLGFLVANLAWLLILPAINRRAERLARRRAELSFPLSMEEIAAERDHLRAEFALKQRELERKAQAGFEARAEALSAMGERDRAIAGLKASVEDRELSIAGLTSELGSTRDDLAGTRQKLADEEKAHALAREDLAVRGQALVERDADIAQLRVERADLTADLQQRTRDLADATARGDRLALDLDGVNAALAQLRAEHDALGAEKDRLRILLAESETVSMARASQITDVTDQLTEARRLLASEKSEHQETRASLAAKAAAYEALEAERDSLALRLKAAEDRIFTLQEQGKALQTDRQLLEGRLIAARQEMDRANDSIRSAFAQQARLETEAGVQRRERDVKIDRLQRDLEAAQAEARKAKSDRALLKQEVAALRKTAEEAAARIAAENEVLRGEILKVGDAFMAGRPGPVVETMSPPLDVANRPKRPARARSVPSRAAE